MTDSPEKKDYGFKEESPDFGYDDYDDLNCDVSDVAWLLPKGQVADIIKQKTVQLVHNLYRSGFSCKEISSLTEINLRTIQRYIKPIKNDKKCKRQGGRLSFNNKHPNEDIFSKIQKDITNNGLK